MAGGGVTVVETVPFGSVSVGAGGGVGSGVGVVAGGVIVVVSTGAGGVTVDAGGVVAVGVVAATGVIAAGMNIKVGSIVKVDGGGVMSDAAKQTCADNSVVIKGTANILRESFMIKIEECRYQHVLL